MLSSFSSLEECVQASSQVLGISPVLDVCRMPGCLDNLLLMSRTWNTSTMLPRNIRIRISEDPPLGGSFEGLCSGLPGCRGRKLGEMVSYMEIANHQSKKELDSTAVVYFYIEDEFFSKGNISKEYQSRRCH